MDTIRYDSRVEAMCFRPMEPTGPLIGFCTVRSAVYIAWQGSVPGVATPVGTEELKPFSYVIRDRFGNLWVMSNVQFDCLYDEYTDDR